MVDTPDLTREQLFGLGLLLALVIVAVWNTATLSFVSMTDNDGNNVDGCEFSTAGDTYTADSCTGDMDFAWTSHKGNTQFITDANRMAGRGSLEGNNWRVAWAAAWSEKYGSFDTGAACVDNPSAHAIELCTSDKAAFDAITDAASPETTRQGDNLYVVEYGQLPQPAVDGLNASCTASIVYWNEYYGTWTYDHDGEVVWGEQRMACRTGVRKETPDGTEMISTTSEWRRATVTWRFEEAFQVAETQPVNESTSGATDGTEPSSEPVDDGDDDGSTGDTGTTDGDDSVLSSVDASIIGAVSGFIDTVAGIFGA